MHTLVADGRIGLSHGTVTEQGRSTDYVVELVAEWRAAEEALSELRTALAQLCGFHSGEGSIPIEKIRALLDGAR